MARKERVWTSSIEKIRNRVSLTYLYGGRYNKKRNIRVTIYNDMLFYGKYEIPLSNIQGFSMRSEEQVHEHLKSRITVTRLTLLGPFAFAAPKRKVQKNHSIVKYLMIDCIEDNFQTSIVFCGESCPRFYNTLRKYLPYINDVTDINTDRNREYDPFEEVMKYKELLDKDIISLEDFNKKKKELLDL